MRAFSPGSVLRRVLAVCGVFAAALLGACGDNPNKGKIRYRLGFSIMVGGEVKSASSVLEVLFYGGGKNAMASPSAVRSYAKLMGGVAPIIDLGSRGMLAAAMWTDGEEYHRRKKEYGLTCQRPKGYDGFLNAFGKSAAELAALRVLRTELPERYYPSFIWIPAGASYRDAQQICWEEIPAVVGPDVRFQSAWVELAPDAPLIAALPISPPWLVELRNDERHRRKTRRAGEYVIQRYEQLERQALKP